MRVAGVGLKSGRVALLLGPLPAFVLEPADAVKLRDGLDEALRRLLLETREDDS